MNIKLAERPRARVVLIYPLIIPDQWPVWVPLDLFAVATALMAHGYEVTFLDEREGPVAREKLIASLEGALFVGMGTKMGDQLGNTVELARLCKQHRPDIPVVIGGWFPSLFPEPLFESEAVDIVTVGPADNSIQEVADRLLEGRSMRGVEGVWAREQGQIVKNPFGHLPDVRKSHPIPWDVLPTRRYMHPGGWINYFSSRGCPGECTFCSIYCLDPKRWTAVRAERVVDDLEQLVGLGFRGFQIMDTDFCADVKRVEAICRGIIDRGLQIRMHVLGRHSTLLKITDEQLRIMRAAGLTEIEVGVESGSQRMADRVRKNLRLDEVPNTVRRYVDHGIRMKLNFLFGLPGEEPSDLVETLRYIEKLTRIGDDAVGLQLFRYVPMPGAAAKDDVWMPKYGGVPPQSLQEYIDFPVEESSTPKLFWLDDKHASTVHNVYAYYSPLALIPAVVDKSAGGRVWRTVLRALRVIARWRVRRGCYALPIDKWFHDRFGYPMRHSSHEAFGPESDLKARPLMGEELAPREPLRQRA